ncbi:MAG: hypothetical protein IJS80_02700 [Lachnospiraceae bacterium]|nr:hypothetical protein [Lachnospiraceae bacterium]
MSDWDYGDSYKRFPVERDETIALSDGSFLMARDITDGLPEFMCKADIIFTDSPWNTGNLRSFYTKAGRGLPESIEEDPFGQFYDVLFDCIGNIKPRVCYLEIGKEYLGECLNRMGKIYSKVTFYNSTYYHKKDNLCYVVQGSDKKKNWKYDGLDEEDIISRIAEDEDYSCIGDLCMGRGLVALAAAKNGKKFVGTELNPKRLAVCLERLNGLGITRIDNTDPPENKVTRLRNNLGLSRAAFSRKYNIPLRTLENWEGGVTSPPDYVISLLYQVTSMKND